MKPILFNTEMVQAILAGNKTQTRRPIKDKDIIYSWDCEKDGTPIAFIEQETGDSYPPTYPAPYQPGNILWVRETWRESYTNAAKEYEYLADAPRDTDEFTPFTWRPSIHMPREASRLFLRVKDVRVERVQDITEQQAKEEGVITNDAVKVSLYKWWFERLWNSCYAAPRPVKRKGIITHYESYPFEDVQETREHKGLPWYVMGNPFVWVTEFEVVNKEVAENAK